MKIRTYSELIQLPTFKERFEYCECGGKTGEPTFDSERYINQKFYRSTEWRRIRRQVVIRDNGCDLGHQDHPIGGRIIIHHLNPLTMDDIYQQTPYLMNPEYLICVSHLTHNAIHFGSIDLLPEEYKERTPGDTCPWKKGESDESQKQNKIRQYVRDARTGKSYPLDI